MPRLRTVLVCAAAALTAACSNSLANAESYYFSFSGTGVSGNVDFTYGAAHDAKYPSALELTGISGTFSDAHLGITNAAITGLVPLTHSTPEPDNHLAPADFSRFPVATGTDHGSQSFDNLFYPLGSPQTATVYPPHGGFVDIYGLLFTIAGGDAVNFWSNGVLAGTLPDYGVAVVTSEAALDTVGGGVTTTPEPASLLLLGTGLLGAFLLLRPSSLADQH